MSKYENEGSRSKLGGTIKLNGTWYTLVEGGEEAEEIAVIKLQKGNPDDVGLNGFTVEDLISIAVDRLKVLNDTIPDPNNNSAMLSLNTALLHLNQRERNRKAAGVAGTAESIPETSRKVELIQPQVPEVKKRGKAKK